MVKDRNRQNVHPITVILNGPSFSNHFYGLSPIWTCEINPVDMNVCDVFVLVSPRQVLVDRQVSTEPKVSLLSICTTSHVQSVCVSAASGSVSHSVVYSVRDMFDHLQVLQDHKDSKERKEVHSVSPHNVSVTL